MAEESGSISEVMERQAEHYHEEAGRSLANLTAIAGYAILFYLVAILPPILFGIVAASRSRWRWSAAVPTP